MTSLPLLQQREIEANVLAPVFRAFAAELGEDRAREILATAIRDLARQAGCAAADSLGGNDLAHLKQVVEQWKVGGALELDILRDDASTLEFNVTRCRYAELYQRLGLTDLGPVLSCARDAELIAGFNPSITFQRAQTIMQGAPHCDFRYHASAPDRPISGA